MSEFLFADQGLNHIPENVTNEQALFVGDILATGYWSAKIGEIREHDTVAVIGAGPTGLCTMMCARLFHPQHIVAIDPMEDRLSLAKQEGWADIMVLILPYRIQRLYWKDSPPGGELMLFLKLPAARIPSSCLADRPAKRNRCDCGSL